MASGGAMTTTTDVTQVAKFTLEELRVAQTRAAPAL